ncbi:WD40-repeat-containing domain protein [Myxozyma melibiosi]|uniref:Eukaryotic translation initiation factor 3 subunit I n=1 Tax=Myxozyma melibiosi TaxID=54550 RepID=A0ABR1F2D0_9ASCO
MRPILLKGHERPLTKLKYNREGDLLFTTARDKIVNVYYSHNGERLGTYMGHQGALWDVDVDPTSTLLVTGAADNTVKLWEVSTGRCLQTWEFNTAVKVSTFNEDADRLLVVTEARMGFQGTIHVYPFVIDLEAKQATEPILTITSPENKFTKAGFSYLSKYIIAGHADGSVSQYDGKTGELLKNVPVHDKEITDLQFAPDMTYFITTSKDKTARILDTKNLKIMKTYTADAPLNTGAITPKKDFIILGGGQDAKDVTTTTSRQGKFEARFYHKIFEDEIGRLKGHFGPLNHIVVHPAGTGFASGGEDGYVRVHHFDKSYYDFLYDVERMRPEN